MGRNDRDFVRLRIAMATRLPGFQTIAGASTEYFILAYPLMPRGRAHAKGRHNARCRISHPVPWTLSAT